MCAPACVHQSTLWGPKWVCTQVGTGLHDLMESGLGRGFLTSLGDLRLDYRFRRKNLGLPSRSVKSQLGVCHVRTCDNFCSGHLPWPRFVS